MANMSAASQARWAAEEAWNNDPSPENLRVYQETSAVEMDEVLANLDSKPHVSDTCQCETCMDKFTYTYSTI